MNNILLKINIQGIVQGVGFRPYVYNLAKRFGICGFVLNSSQGVEIHAQGVRENLDSFLYELKTNPPKLSVITTINYHEETPKNNHFYNDFTIKDSIPDGNKSVLISPDISICDKCKSELFDLNNRRFHYPFINCTDCGPRFSIIEDIPYDRKYTSMKIFPMCPECEGEYGNPDDRRFHAQPDACFLCGPMISLLDNKGKKTFYDLSNNIEEDKDKIIYQRRQLVDEIILHSVNLLKEGKIIAIKGIGGYHLAVNAENGDAVERLRLRKNRYEKPLAVMSFNFERIEKYAFLTDEDKNLLESIQKPIVLLKKKEPNNLSNEIAPKSDCFGVMLPYTPLHYLLLENDFTALVMTSGNISDEPICYKDQDALEKLSGIADYFLIHNREIHFRCDDSVIRNLNISSSASDKKSDFSRIFIRRSRGYAPSPIFLDFNLPNILALGAELKNTVCLIKENRAFLSQHIGDLENIETLDYFEETINHLKNILQIQPEIIAHDLHPEYLNSKWISGKECYFEKEIIEVQHHHAHIASCMAENKIKNDVIGFSMDGTGYGTDGSIWGGEVMIANYKSFERYSHFEYLPMPGGDTAIREPWRMGIALLYHHFGEDLFKLNIPILKDKEKDKILTIISMIRKNINTFNTSSLGRLFDAVSSLINLRYFVSYEGQSAIEFENLIYKSKNVFVDKYYKFDLDNNNIITTKEMTNNLIADIQKNVSLPEISRKFHLGVVKILVLLSQKIRNERQINRVVLSGGCFQNSFLTENLKEELVKERFEVFTHRLLPPNDGGISLGQAVIAGSRFI